MPLRAWLLVFALAAPIGSPAAAWMPESRVAIADWAARIAPPALRGQIEHRMPAFHEGVLTPLERRKEHGLVERITLESGRAVAMIEQHRSFDDVVYQLGVVSQLVATAANPLDASDADPEEALYYEDFLLYARSTEARLQPVFYGIPAEGDTAGNLEDLIATTLEHSRRLYPAVGREYRRIGFAEGRRRFDDRSTAFGVVSVAYSRAISDVAVALRYIWLRSGGDDTRAGLPVRGR